MTKALWMQISTVPKVHLQLCLKQTNKQKNRLEELRAACINSILGRMDTLRYSRSIKLCSTPSVAVAQSQLYFPGSKKKPLKQQSPSHVQDNSELIRTVNLNSNKEQGSVTFLTLRFFGFFSDSGHTHLNHTAAYPLSA